MVKGFREKRERKSRDAGWLVKSFGPSWARRMADDQGSEHSQPLNPGEVEGSVAAFGGERFVCVCVCGVTTNYAYMTWNYFQNTPP